MRSWPPPTAILENQSTSGDSHQIRIRRTFAGTNVQLPDGTHTTTHRDARILPVQAIPLIVVAVAL
jgi:hypothetical protein